MSDWLAFPPVRELAGHVAVPGSKSASNRALVLAALSPTPVQILGLLDSEDTRALARCLRAMGARIESSVDATSVAGPLGVDAAGTVELDAGESGTAARFLAALAAAVPGRFRLTGSRRLSQRPMFELVDALRAGGAGLEAEEPEAGALPLGIAGGSLRAAAVAVDASRSSQFLSALLIAGAARPEGIEVRAEGRVASAPYVAMTVAALAEFGYDVVRTGATIRVRPGRGAPERYRVPGDYSSAVPLLAACGIAGGEILVSGLDFPSGDPDASALPVLASMGMEIRGDPAGVRARRGAGTALSAVRVRAADFPDAVPALAALAAFADGESRFEGIAHLRGKESDRIASLAALFEAAGVPALAASDSLRVGGGSRDASASLRLLPTAGDHRIAMAAALLSLRIGGALIQSPGCVAKSYPAFFRDLDSLCIRPGPS
jgi:3-phosphoshikimate 1-carboxyvinyltransferase